MLFSVYAGKDKKIWLGSDMGVNYFSQQKKLFRIGYPFGSGSPHTLTRGIEEDHEGNLLASEGVDANYMDIINYCVFALIRLEEIPVT